jgi:hypothetical protein
MTKTFCGDLIDRTGSHIGCVHKAEGGYVVRKPIEFGRGPGPVVFGGRVFKGNDFSLVRKTNLGYAIIKTFKLVEAA